MPTYGSLETETDREGSLVLKTQLLQEGSHS